MKEMAFYGTALPGVEQEPYSGKLIVIEGTDGVGRSTHIALLREWLEARGHAVLDTGMTRSVLAGRGIKRPTGPHARTPDDAALLCDGFRRPPENQMLRRCARASSSSRIVTSIRRLLGRSCVGLTLPGYALSMVSRSSPTWSFYLRIRSAEELVPRMLTSDAGSISGSQAGHVARRGFLRQLRRI